ncbi:MAG: amidohydrolase family protein [Caldisphaeraceae archaeon]|nr:amidohydrolase family protein [Caldisphaeraceae archaeon]
MKADLPVSCIIDAHVHMPFIGNREEVNLYLRKLLSTGVRGAVILGIPSFKSILDKISYNEVLKEYEKSKHLIERYAGEIKDMLTPERLFIMAHQLSDNFCGFNKHKEISLLTNFSVLFPSNLSLDPEELSSLLENSIKEGFRGFKVISTIFLKRLDDPSVEATIAIANEKGLPVTVHGGCDPGIWELPRFCKYGDPSRLDPLLKKYKDVKVVIAHAGSYSAIAPGVFMEETLELVKKYENVYVDTSALPAEIVKVVMREFPSERVLYGSDYPAVVNSDAKDYMEEVFLSLTGTPRSSLEKFAHENAESVFGIECITENYDLVE